MAGTAEAGIRVIERERRSDYEDEFQVISTHLSAGKTVIHVLSEDKPDDQFEPVDANLEDVYFSTLKVGAAPSAAA